MNIFVLDSNPKLAAQYHCDNHVVKMTLESAQILCSVHHIYSTAKQWFYKPTHLGHPCVEWAAENDKNYYWLWCLFYWLSQEFNERNGKRHASDLKLLNATDTAPNGIPLVNQVSDFALAMPDEYVNTSDAVASYRAYYMAEKRHIAKWYKSKHGQPDWWK